MATTINFNCPNCDSPLIVPAEAAGKRIKCKHCGEVVTVSGKAPTAKPAAKAAAPGSAKPPAAKPVVKAVPPPPPPAPAEDANAPFKLKDDDDDDNPNPYGMVAERDVPRCPHCATELDPPDTKVCLNCGYDLMTRQRHKSKKVYETTGQQRFEYMLPAFVWIVALIFYSIFYLFCILNMESWLTGSIFDKDKPDEATLKPTFYIGSGCFGMMLSLIFLPLLWFGIPVIVKRLITHPKPPEIEKIVGEDDEDEEGDDEDDDDDEDEEEEDEPPKKKKRKP
jgi:predicted RNA-binding Zn-ribbon protein involved in translation (DUF1610 family)